MFGFIKNYSSLIIKFVVNQIALTLFGLVLYLSTYKITGLAVATSVFSLIFYCYLLIISSVEFGKRDKIRIESGRMEAKPLTGLYASLAANCVNIILALGIIVGKLFTNVKDGVVFGNIFEKLSLANDFLAETPSWSYNLLVIFQPLFNILNGMYMGIINTFSPNNSSAFLIALIPSIAASWFGYYIGMKDLPITKLFEARKSYQDNK